MRKFARTMTMAFSAGALGGLVNSVCVWLAVTVPFLVRLGSHCFAVAEEQGRVVAMGSSTLKHEIA